MFNGLHRVFRHPAYITLSVIIALLVFTFAVLIPNFSLLSQVIPSKSISLDDKISLVFSLFESIQTNFTTLSATYTIFISVLFGINIALLTYYISKRKGTFQGKGSALGIGGLVSGVFGIGCAACGTFILASLLALVGAGGVIAFLPLGGEEFGILGVALIGYATYWTAKKIEDPLVCDTD